MICRKISYSGGDIFGKNFLKCFIDKFFIKFNCSIWFLWMIQSLQLFFENTITNISTNKVKITGMEGTFEECMELYNFTLDGFDGSALTSMKNLFFQTSLYSYEFTNFDTSNVKDVSNMFSACNGLSSFSLKGLDLSSVTDMS